jgi:hypothetical protein
MKTIKDILFWAWGFNNMWGHLLVVRQVMDVVTARIDKDRKVTTHIEKVNCACLPCEDMRKVTKPKQIVARIDFPNLIFKFETFDKLYDELIEKMFQALRSQEKKLLKKNKSNILFIRTNFQFLYDEEKHQIVGWEIVYAGKNWKYKTRRRNEIYKTRC